MRLLAIVLIGLLAGLDGANNVLAIGDLVHSAILNQFTKTASERMPVAIIARRQKGTAAFQRFTAIPTIGRNRGPSLFEVFGVSQ